MNNGKVCVPVCARTADEMVRKVKAAEDFADLIELRFDCLSKEELEALIRDRDNERGPRTTIESIRPIISTLRPRNQGGHRELSLDDRRAFWNSGCRTGYCDVEEEVMGEPGLLSYNGKICSFHDLSAVPDNINEIDHRLLAARPSAIKIAVTAADVTDAIPVWKLLDLTPPNGNPGPGIIPIAMGEAGKWTRILGLAHGAFLTYASLDTEEGTAPGQITAEDLLDVYRVKELDQGTEVYGVIGDPVTHSLSPYLHNPAFVAAGLNAVFIPLAVKDLDQFVERMVRDETREVELNFAGFSVTMPHKQAIMQHLDEIDPAAKKIGAVNTVKIENGRLIGFNTDAAGFIAPLRERAGDLTGCRVALVGTGGAARACAYALEREGAVVTIAGRSVERAKELAAEFGISARSLADLTGRLNHDFDIIVNATPLGMKGPDERTTPFRSEQLAGIQLVYDLVTSPIETPIVSEAREAGVDAIGGVEMLIAQGIEQFEIWTRRSAPVAVMKAGVSARMKQEK